MIWVVYIEPNSRKGLINHRVISIGFNCNNIVVAISTRTTVFKKLLSIFSAVKLPLANSPPPENPKKPTHSFGRYIFIKSITTDIPKKAHINMCIIPKLLPSFPTTKYSYTLVPTVISASSTRGTNGARFNESTIPSAWAKEGMKKNMQINAKKDNFFNKNILLSLFMISIISHLV